MEPIEEIKARLTIEEVVGQYVQLHKAGKNYKALCPFHNEKTPSFMISPDKGIAYCFGCQKGGDIFKFVQLVENISFPESVQMLAEKAGVELPTFSKEKQEVKKQTLEINEAVTRFYEDQLSKDQDKKDYLLKRGVTEQTMKDFRLGYAPDSYDKTHKYLLQKGFSRLEIVNSGLGGSKDTANNEVYDRFRGRMMFPISNVLSKVIAFGGRTLKEEKTEAKYLNSPDSPTYNKSLVLYGLDKAKSIIRQEDKVIVVEGYMDVIASYQAGIKNVVASSGTALTQEQIKLLKRYTNNFIFAFDTDEAGKTATHRALELAIENDVNVRIAQVPNGKDPDECIRQDLDLWIKTIEEAVSMLEFTLSDLMVKFDSKTVQGKKQIIQEILPIIKKYPNRIEQEEYIRQVANRLQIHEGTLRSELVKIKNIKIQRINKDEDVAKKMQLSREKYLFGMLFNFPQFYNLLNQELVEKIFLDNDTKRFYKTIKSQYNPPRKFNVEEFLKDLSDSEKEECRLWQLFVEEKYNELPEERIEQEFKNIIREINKFNLSEVKKKLVFDLKAAKLKDPEQYLLVLNQYNQVLKLRF